MKKKLMALMVSMSMVVLSTAGCGGAASTGEAQTPVETEAVVAESAAPAGEDAVPTGSKEYKVGIAQFVDDASLNQIEKNIEEELAKKGAEYGVTFTVSLSNGQADATTLNQIAADFIADDVDVIVPIATPAALIMQAATEDNQIPVVFSAVSDPVAAGLVASLDAPGSNITGTSDALNTKAVMDLMFAANPDIQSVGMLYNNSEDASKQPIADAKKYCEEKGVKVVEKTGTTNDEVIQAAEALVAAQVDAVFTPTDNTIMTAELSIYEKFLEAGIPHYAGADSFALNGAFCGYGVNYAQLGVVTADMIADILVNSKNPAEVPVQLLDNGIATVNIETAAALELDYGMFKDLAAEVKETKTAEEFE